MVELDSAIIAKLDAMAADEIKHMGIATQSSLTHFAQHTPTQYHVFSVTANVKGETVTHLFALGSMMVPDQSDIPHSVRQHPKHVLMQSSVWVSLIPYLIGTIAKDHDVEDSKIRLRRLSWVSDPQV